MTQPAPQLTHAQKVEIIGVLASGIAHDFNNVLTVILGQAGLLLNELTPSQQRKRVEVIHDAAERATTLTRKLLAFSRREVIQPRVFDLNVLIAELMKLLGRLIHEDIEVVTSLGAAPATIRADPGQIEQVIINLAINAQDAMPNGGRLTIETVTAEVDPAIGEGTRKLVLTVTDTGTGMTDDVKTHLFEAFFTTKEPGRGTGLGLATIHDIVKQSSGEIACQSQPGHGTVFTISLPLVEAEATPIRGRWVDGDLPQGNATILLVEDNGDIREIVRDVLTEQGYRVLEAPDGERALTLSRDHVGPIQLLLTDVVLPGMSGRKLAEELSAARPEAKALYMSGHTDDTILRKGALAGHLAFLWKPFTPLQLASMVRETLNARAAGPGSVTLVPRSRGDIQIPLGSPVSPRGQQSSP